MINNPRFVLYIGPDQHHGRCCTIIFSFTKFWHFARNPTYSMKISEKKSRIFLNFKFFIKKITKNSQKKSNEISDKNQPRKTLVRAFGLPGHGIWTHRHCMMDHCLLTYIHPVMKAQGRSQPLQKRRD